MLAASGEPVVYNCIPPVAEETNTLAIAAAAVGSPGEIVQKLAVVNGVLKVTVRSTSTVVPVPVVSKMRPALSALPVASERDGLEPAANPALYVGAPPTPQAGENDVPNPVLTRQLPTVPYEPLILMPCVKLMKSNVGPPVNEPIKTPPLSS